MCKSEAPYFPGRAAEIKIELRIHRFRSAPALAPTLETFRDREWVSARWLMRRPSARTALVAVKQSITSGLVEISARFSDLLQCLRRTFLAIQKLDRAKHLPRSWTGTTSKSLTV